MGFYSVKWVFSKKKKKMEIVTLRKIMKTNIFFRIMTNLLNITLLPFMPQYGM